MKTAADVVVALEQTNSRLDKEEIVRQAWRNKIYDFFEGAKLAYDSMVTFGVKKVPASAKDGLSSTNVPFNHNVFMNLSNELRDRKITGHAARDAIAAVMSKASMYDWNNFYKRVLGKDLKCGVSETTINKILEEFGKPAEKYLVKVFSCQLAKNADDRPQYMNGEKFLDVKLDGVRLLTILDKSNNTVTQYSRNGKQNENFEHICKALSNLLPHIKESVVLDGEVTSRSFQSLMKQLNRKGDVNTSDAKLALFDIIPLKDFLNDVCKIKQKDRHASLEKFSLLLEEHTKGSVYVIPKKLVDLDTEQGQDEYKEFNRYAIDNNFEGVMIKDLEAPYKTKRVDAWLKLKPFYTWDLEIVAVEPGKAGSKFEHTMGAILCRGDDGNGKKIEVSVGGGWSEELRDEMWKHRKTVIGRIVEVKGDCLTLSQGSVDEVWGIRFPVFVCFRGWKPGEKI